MGRLLITSFLVWKKIMAEPRLYLSAYPKAHQQEYYDRLMQVCNSGDHEAWAHSFLEGVVTVSGLVVQTTRRIRRLERTDTERLMEAGIGHSGLLLMRFLLEQAVLHVKDIEKSVGISYAKANGIIVSAERLGMLTQINQGERNPK